MNGTIQDVDLANNAVSTDKIQNNAVTENKILDGAVAPEKLSADPADEGKVGVVQPDGTVVYQNLDSENIDGKDLSLSAGLEFTGGTDGTGKLLADAGIGIADAGITTAKLANDAVTNDKLADNAVTSANIVDGTIATADLANGAVTPEKLSADTADAGKVATVQPDGTVVYENINASDITGTENLLVSNGIESTGTTDGVNALLVETGIGIADAGITTAKLANDAVTNDKLADNAVTSANIVDGTVATVDLANNAVSENKILDGAVAPEKLSADPADEGKVGVVQPDGTVVYQNLDSENIDGKDLTAGDGSILVTNGTGTTLVDTSIQVSDGGITNAKLASDAVSESKIQDGAVTSSKILNGTIQDVDLANNAVSTDKIQNNAVTENKILDGAVAPEKLSADPADEGKVGVVQPDGTVVYQNLDSENIDGKDLSLSAGLEFTGGTDGTGKLLADAGIGIADAGITTAKLANDAVTNDKLADNAVTSANIVDGTIATADLADNAVTENKILDGAVAPEKLSADPADEGKVGVVQPDGTVVYQNLDSENIDGKDLTAADGSIVVTDGTGTTLVDTSIQVSDGGITNTKLANNAVTNDKLANNAVTSANIVDGTIATADLANGAVTPEKLSADTADAGKVATVQPDGTVVYENINASDITGTENLLVSNGIEFTGTTDG